MMRTTTAWAAAPPGVQDWLPQVLTTADCRRRQVAAVVVDADTRLVGTGSNGLPGYRSCVLGDCPRGLLSYGEVPAFSTYTGNCDAIHAEDAALRMAGDRAAGGTIYVTCEPCPWCADLIAAAGVVHTVVVEPGSSAPAPLRGP